MTTKKPAPTPAGGVVYCRYIRRGGKVIYPKKGRVFRFVVRRKK